MEQDIKTLLVKIDTQAADIADIKKRVKRTEMIILWTGIITVAAIVLPLIGLAFAVPKYLDQLNSLQSLDF